MGIEKLTKAAHAAGFALAEDAEALAGTPQEPADPTPTTAADWRGKAVVRDRADAPSGQDTRTPGMLDWLGGLIGKQPA